MNMKYIRSTPPLSDALPPERPARASARRKLWAIEQRYMCSVIGTCLGVRDIRKLALRDQLCSPDISDYDLHGLIVRTAKGRSKTSRSIQKLLERRFASAVRRFSAAKTEDAVLTLWNEATTSGDIPGPMWALMTHPKARMRAWEQAFGDVHMLSHVLGATRRVDLKEFKAVSSALEAEREKTAQLRRLLRETLTKQEASESRIASQRVDIEALRAKLSENGDALTLMQQLEDAQLALAQAQSETALEVERRLSAERKCRRLRAANIALTTDVASAHTQRDAAFAETEAVEQHLLARTASTVVEAEAATSASNTLGGLSVLYVGGRTGLVPHYRAIIQHHGGTFTHHDGGLEQRCTQIDVLVRGADLVMCPVDAISHSASLRVKKACKRASRPFVPLRSCSLACLLTAARRPSSEATAPPAPPA